MGVCIQMIMAKNTVGTGRGKHTTIHHHLLPGPLSGLNCVVRRLVWLQCGIARMSTQEKPVSCQNQEVLTKLRVPLFSRHMMAMLARRPLLLLSPRRWRQSLRQNCQFAFPSLSMGIGSPIISHRWPLCNGEVPFFQTAWWPHVVFFKSDLQDMCSEWLVRGLVIRNLVCLACLPLVQNLLHCVE